jgi:hypothetical protein
MNKFLKHAAAALAVSFFGICQPLVAHAQATQSPVPEAKRAAIVRLMDITNASAMGVQMASQMAGLIAQELRKRNSKITQADVDALTRTVEAVVKENIPTFNEVTIRIYSKHFSEEEVRGMIAFYETDLGKKVIGVMPALMQESVQAGGQWGASLQPEIERRVRQAMKERGVEL